MDQITNPAVASLAQTLLRQMEEHGYAKSTLDTTRLLARRLNDFMERSCLQTYDESIGERFIEAECQRRDVTTHYLVKLFIARIDSIVHGTGLIIYRSISIPTVLPQGLDEILTSYREHCIKSGCVQTTIVNYEERCRRFLKFLADDGVYDTGGITTASISKACLRISGETDFPVVKRFLKFLFHSGFLDRDYSCVIPKWTRPQPMPSVYQ